MADLATGLGVVFETTAFLHYFKVLPDNRQPGKVIYPLNEVLLLSLLAVLAGAESFTDIARFGEKKLASCAGSCPLPTVRRRMTGWARFSPRSTRRHSSGALSTG